MCALRDAFSKISMYYDIYQMRMILFLDLLARTQMTPHSLSGHTRQPSRPPRRTNNNRSIDDTPRPAPRPTSPPAPRPAR